MCMIQWPAEAHLPPAAVKSLALFRSSQASAELTSAPALWTIINWSWTLGPPTRIIVQDEGEQALTYSTDDGVHWTSHEHSIAKRNALGEYRAG
jgi:hypothetical protein